MNWKISFKVSQKFRFTFRHLQSDLVICWQVDIFSEILCLENLPSDVFSKIPSWFEKFLSSVADKRGRWQSWVVEVGGVLLLCFTCSKNNIFSPAWKRSVGWPQTLTDCCFSWACQTGNTLSLDFLPIHIFAFFGKRSKFVSSHCLSEISRYHNWPLAIKGDCHKTMRLDIWT